VTVIGASCFAVFLFTIGLRGFVLVPLAFGAQSVSVFVIEMLDGFWLPLWLSMFVGALTWVATLLLVMSVGRRPRQMS
jgi:hypothetical protein